MAKKPRKHFHKHHAPTPQYTPVGDESVLSKQISDIGLSTATLDILTAGKVLTVRDICMRTEREMFKVQRFGKKNLDEVRKIITSLGVNFRPFEKKEDSVTPSIAPCQNNKDQKSETKEDKKQNRAGDPEEWVKITKNGKWGFKNLLGKEVIPAVYDEIFLFHEGLACYETRGEFGYIDQNNKVVIEPKYECAMSFSEGLASVTLDGKCGYINKSGEVVIDYAYDAATAFSGGFARVKLDGKWGVIDIKGEVNWNK